VSASISWIHIGDLHMDAADGWASLPRLEAIVDEINAHALAADFVFLPGDNANHAAPDQYAAIVGALSRLALPWRAIPGDHDFEGGSLAGYEAAFAAVNRPEVEVIAGHRCVFVDVVSAGAGGPDFRLTPHHFSRVGRELSRAKASGQVPLVFMHTYPGDLSTGSAEVAQLLAEAEVAFVDTGHTHYNELLNDGRVVYGATRSTAQIEEGAGASGFSVICVHDEVPSWRFRSIGAHWPHVQIVAPCDLRLVTKPADARQVPRPGKVYVAARRFGDGYEAMVACVDERPGVPMTHAGGGLWEVQLEVGPGLHRVVVTCDGARDTVKFLVRDAESTPKRVPPLALGHAIHAIGEWPAAGVVGLQLGPNRNGCDW
jgi:Icc protein